MFKYVPQIYWIFSFYILAIGFIFDINRVVKAEEFEKAFLLNNFGMPGEIELPSAVEVPYGQYSISSSTFGGTLRVQLSFQFSNKLTGAFRYSRIPSAGGDFDGYFWDRSFDIHYQVRNEGKAVPSIALGLRDFIGTGLYSGEYLVATKSFGSRLAISGGIGWGRLSGENTHKNIFGRNNRVRQSIGTGGTFHINNFFSGDNSPFMSLSYDLTEKLQFISEYSSDSYSNETSSPKGFTRKNDFNFGLKYKFDPTISIIGSFIHGDKLGLTLNIGVNPRNSPYKSGIEPAPMPILETNFLRKNQSSEREIFLETKRLLMLDGIDLKNLKITGNFIDVDIENRRYFNVSQMTGRVARILSRTSPTGIKKFRINIIDHQSNFFISEIIIDRKELVFNELNFDGPERLWNSTSIDNSKKFMTNATKKNLEKLTWSFYPYFETMLFDPDDPFRWTIGAELDGKYKFSMSTAISSSVRFPLTGTMDDVKRGPKAGLPNVRSDFMYYNRDTASKLFINHLTVDKYIKPRSDIYALINFGYLELMHAGIRSEIIWKDNKKPFALGLDLAQVQKRGTYGDFSLKDEFYSTYLASFYYDLPNDWTVKIDAGKYLAGDIGSTLSIERTFNNGWQIGAFATLTDVPFSRFGEGSFDKGLTIKAPITWFTGKKSKSFLDASVRPITGDGGAKLKLNNDHYLYPIVSEYDTKSLSDNWKRFFR